jgi:hypothetical protein
MEYKLSDEFTAKPERTNFWRKFDGRNQFRVISDNFIQVFSQWVNRPDGKGYSRMWPFDVERPDLEAGESWEVGSPARKVVFCVSPVEGHDGGAPAVLVVNQQVAKQMLALATELQGLTVADFILIADGRGTNKTFTVMAAKPSPLNPELHEMGARYDLLADL